MAKKIINESDDFKSERGRNAAVKKYEKLIKGVAGNVYKDTGYNWDECYAAALMGFVWAMNTYNSNMSGDELVKDFDQYAEEASEDADGIENKEVKDFIKNSNKKATTFEQWAGFAMRNFIWNEMTAHGRTVRIPAAEIKRMREEGGYTTGQTVSLSSPTYSGGDGENDFEHILNDEGGIGGYDIEDTPSDKQPEEIMADLVDEIQKLGGVSDRDLDIWKYAILRNLQGNKRGTGETLTDYAAKIGLSKGAASKAVSRVTDFIVKNRRKLNFDIPKLYLK